jgi:hypothetical protein
MNHLQITLMSRGAVLDRQRFTDARAALRFVLDQMRAYCS